jgi:hypothetical protein
MKKPSGFPPAMIFMLLADREGICTVPENDCLGNVTQVIINALTGQIAAYLEFYEFFTDGVLAGVPDYVPKEIVENEPYFEVWFDENGLLTGHYIYNDNLSENPETESANLLTRIGFNNTEPPVIEVPEYTIVK